ncbi:gas vesicle protein [Cereibacter sphaeroides]|uniref:gas vesicle protein n=1 Tax=Cereibacter sphaeroides TaxID=1063 RepID=UPI000E5A692B|nr:gas vesicle protein [Cereibacter sphaeroides]RHZ99459.1 gas vesicle protein [Cereibacter sphaeroides]
MSFQMQSPLHQDSLADVLERILAKGIVIAGDISISLVGIELLTIRLRLLVATVDKAREMGINWWESDPRLCSTPVPASDGSAALLDRLERIETQIGQLAAAREA